MVVRTGPAWPAGAAPVTDWPGWPRLAEAGGRPALALALAGRAGRRGVREGGACWAAASPHGRMLWRRWLTKSTMSSRRVHPASRACTMTWSTTETRWCSAFGPRRPFRGKGSALPCRGKLLSPDRAQHTGHASHRAPARLGPSAAWAVPAGHTGLRVDIPGRFGQRGLVWHDRGAGRRSRLGRRRDHAGYRDAGRARRHVHGELAGVAW